MEANEGNGWRHQCGKYLKEQPSTRLCLTFLLFFRVDLFWALRHRRCGIAEKFMNLLFNILFMVTVLAPALDPTATQVRDLFERAAVQYETAEYKEAVELFTEAYRLSPDIEDAELRGLVQADIFFNLARAHSKSYRFDKDPEHLLQAEDLLTKYLSQTADLAEKQDAEQFLKETQDELARLESLAGQGSPSKTKDSSNGRGLIATGVSFISIGALGGGAAIAGAVLSAQARQSYIEGPTREDRDDAQKKGELGDQLILTGSITAGVLVTTGIILTVVGVKKKRRFQPTAWVLPTGVGLNFTGRF